MPVFGTLSCKADRNMSASLTKVDDQIEFLNITKLNKDILIVLGEERGNVDAEVCKLNPSSPSSSDVKFLI
ncbi:hypothetical protein R84981_001410 [Carnimonas sp. R-84981]